MFLPALAAFDRDRGGVERRGDIADLLFGQGTAGFAQASGAETLTVGQGATRTALAASTASGTLGQLVQSSTYGQPLTFTATVSVLAPAAGVPGGLVTFQEAGVAIGQQPLDGTGRATLTVSSLGAGTRAVTATYPGDASFSTSTSDPSSLAIAKATAAVALVPSQATSVTGERVHRARAVEVRSLLDHLNRHGGPAGEEAQGEARVERFWSSLPAREKARALASRDAWCMPVPVESA